MEPSWDISPLRCGSQSIGLLRIVDDVDATRQFSDCHGGILLDPSPMSILTAS
jgi:hypothetical protein